MADPIKISKEPLELKLIKPAYVKLSRDAITIEKGVMRLVQNEGRITDCINGMIGYEPIVDENIKIINKIERIYANNPSALIKARKLFSDRKDITEAQKKEGLERIDAILNKEVETSKNKGIFDYMSGLQSKTGKFKVA